MYMYIVLMQFFFLILYWQVQPFCFFKKMLEVSWLL